jgi:hypothetical protein
LRAIWRNAIPRESFRVFARQRRWAWLRSPEMILCVYLPRSEIVLQCHSEKPFGHAQDKFRDEESAFCFVVSEHQRGLRTKSRSFARAQDDTGAIFRIAKQPPAEDEGGSGRRRRIGDRPITLLKAILQVIQPGVKAAARQKFLMASLFPNLALVDNQDPIGMLDR